MMRTIDKQTWNRREHYEFFKTFNHPHFNMCANMDLTKTYTYIREKDLSFTAVIIYLISRTANEITEFRLRIRGEDVVEHETVSPSATILVDNDLFGFCSIDYCQDFAEFSRRTAAQIKAAKEHLSLSDPPGRDDLLFMTAIPWVSFTSFTHPMRQHPADSIPRFAWGKYFEESGKLKMPLSVQGHHALMDGIHLSRFYEHIQNYLLHPEEVLAD